VSDLKQVGQKETRVGGGLGASCGRTEQLGQAHPETWFVSLSGRSARVHGGRYHPPLPRPHAAAVHVYVVACTPCTL
jgi:hypothetical protein